LKQFAVGRSSSQFGRVEKHGSIRLRLLTVLFRPTLRIAGLVGVRRNIVSPVAVMGVNIQTTPDRYLAKEARS
jgi:hypothetical protein